MNGGKYMICDLCGNVTENKRAIGMYMRAARITYIECPECGCALSIKELRAAVRKYNQQFEETRYNHNHDSKGRFCSGSGAGESTENGVDKGRKSGIIKEKGFDSLDSSNVVNVLRNDSEEWINELSSEEMRAIKKYTKNSGDPADDKFYARLNAMLRGNIPRDDTLNYYSEQISNGISKFKLRHNITCYRVLDRDVYSAFSAGDLLIEKQFVSTSVVKSGTLNKPFKVTINVPKGTKGAYIEGLSKYKTQREFLLDKNLIYKVIAKNEGSIELEVIQNE